MGQPRSTATPRPETKQATRHALAYQPALDGIRALAVAAVLAYHAGLPWARGGFLGVDAFFVLSGYLITTLLLIEHRARGRIDLIAFWGRRARRLLPALFLMLCGVAVYAVAFAGSEELARLRADALATIGYVANWRPVFAGESYFEQFAVPSPLRHTWSLAIEEQWYLVWPPLLLGLLWLRKGRGLLLLAPLALLCASAILMAALHDPADLSRVYYGTDTRAQSLLVGAVLAVCLANGSALRPFPRYALEGLAVVCVAFLAWNWATLTGASESLYRGGFLLLAAAVAVVIVASVQPRGIIRSALSFAPLRGLGIISYGVYLWHWPVYLMLTPERTGWDGYPLFAMRVGLTLAVSIASYLLIERPLRRASVWRWRPSWALAPAGAAAVTVAVLLVTAPRPPAPVLSVSASIGEPLPPVPAPLGATEGSPPALRVLFVGDSVGATLGRGLDRREAQENMLVWNKSVLGCGFARSDELLIESVWRPTRPACWEWWNDWPSVVERFRPDVVVLLFGAWDVFDLRYGGQTFDFKTPEADAYLVAELSHAIDLFSAQGAKVVVLTAPYYEARDLGLGIAYDNDRFDSANVDHLNALFREAARQWPRRAELIDLNAFLLSAGYTVNDSDMLVDGVHFSDAGAEFVAAWLMPQLRAMQEAGASAARDDAAVGRGG